jgi:prepilin-type N-terminal cleavage/methylation domain-containing protein/prepilin-type processing-associated H-X9-DG protein
MHRSRKAAFTLIELLVVLALTVLLAAILYPVLSQARQASHRFNCISNLRQLAHAHLMYVQDNDDALPCWFGGSLAHYVLWPAMLRPYYRDPGILKDVSPSEARAGEVWTADYALCAWGAGGKGTREKPDWLWPGAVNNDPRHRGPMRLAEVARPADTLQFADGATYYYARSFPGSYIRQRHETGLLNGAFLDGHARAVPDRLWSKIGQDERGYFYWIAAADR